MRIVAGVFTFVIFLLSACSDNKSRQGVIDSVASKIQFKKTSVPIKKDTITYEYVSLDTRYKSCKHCNYVAISYPELKNQSRLKDTINTILWSWLDFDLDVNYKPSADFRKTFESYKKNFPSGIDSTANPNAIWAEHSITIERQDPGLIVLNIEDDASGGAHPQFQIDFLNWNTMTDNIITLDDIFAKGYGDQLTDIAEKIFRKDEGLSADEPLTNYFFENQEFALNNNFRITNEGISFYYNTYEIKPYMQGTTDLLIPYSQIKHLLRPNTVVSQYIK